MFNVRDILPSLSTLALSLKSNATKTVLTLARIAENHYWCQQLLEYIIQELEELVWDDRSCPLLNDLVHDDSAAMLWAGCSSRTIVEQQSSVRLLLLIAPQSPFMYHQTIATLLAANDYGQNANGLSAVMRLINANHGSPEHIQIQPAIERALDRCQFDRYDDNSCGDDIGNDGAVNVLTNLVALIRYERKSPGGEKSTAPGSVTQTTTKCMAKILNIFGAYLTAEMRSVEMWQSDENGADEEVVDDDSDRCSVAKRMKMSTNRTQKIHILAELLDCLEIGAPAAGTPPMESIIKLAQLTVKYFFWALTEPDATVRLRSVSRSYTMLNRQCTVRKSSRTIALRELLEGALFLYGNLFGAHTETDTVAKWAQRKDTELLIKANQRQGSAPNAVRSILHAGIIGHGLKAPSKEPAQPHAIVQNMFLDAIAACCKSEDTPTTIDGFSTVSLLLVEMVSTDVMYNGLPWPDEETFTKVTMERDLQIRRTFRNAPILWAILALVAAYRPALCFTSVLLRALCASVLHQWRAKTVDRYQIASGTNAELYEVTRKLLEVMAMGQLLPPPLSLLPTVIEHLDAPEIAVVLKECIWNYMKDNVPAPVLFGVDSSGTYVFLFL